MNPTPQLAPHLDAELISAFVENALPAHERQAVMGHLAGCAHCRQIVYLAQDTAQDATPSSSSPAFVLDRPAGRPSWFANWRFVWLPACAALVAIAIVVTVVRHAPHPAPEIAENTPSAGKASAGKASANQPSASQPPPQSNAVGAIAPASPPPPVAVSPNAQISSDTLSRSKTSRSRLDSKDQAPEPQLYANQIASQNAALNTLRDEKQNATRNTLQAAPIEANAQALKTDSSNGAKGIGGIAAGITANQSQNLAVQPAPQSSNENVTVNASASTVNVVAADTVLNQEQVQQTADSSSIAAESLKELPLKGRNADSLSKSKKKKKTSAAANGPVLAQAAPAAPANAPVTDSAIAQDKAAPAGQSAGTGAAFGAFHAPSADDAAARKALYTRMPSGLAAISTASAQHRTLAIDSAGALFLSEDDGQSWQPIAPQWTGRAVQLRVHAAPAAKADSGYIAPQAEANAGARQTAQSPPSAMFELVTDSVSTWSSTDGKTWRRGLP